MDKPPKHTFEEAKAWLAMAERVLAGEFDKVTNSMRESLRIGLRHLEETPARRAIRRLNLFEKK